MNLIETELFELLTQNLEINIPSDFFPLSVNYVS